MIERLVLKNFRKFSDRVLEFNKNIIILYGQNAQGKSSVLESIYILCNGNSPWAPTDEYINTEQKNIPHVRIEIQKDQKQFVYFKENTKKILKIDGRNVRPKTFYENNSATIFNPEQIELLMISPYKRRDFLDNTILKYDYEYEQTLKQFKKILRQRNAHLKKLAKLFYEKGIIAINDTQLSFWTNNLVDTSVNIIMKRALLCRALSNEEYDIKYESNFEIDKRKISNFEYVRQCIDKGIEESKRRDIATGYTNTGPHRDDWSIHNGVDIKKFGSRGEKRLAIGKLIFQTQEIVKEKTGFYPILLLDDIASELDVKNTEKIFAKNILDKQQTFITVIDPNTLPKEILNDSQMIDLNIS